MLYNFLQFAVTSFHKSKYSPQYLVLDTLNLQSFLMETNEVSYQYKTMKSIYSINHGMVYLV
jgi:hypothetical protein